MHNKWTLYAVIKDHVIATEVNNRTNDEGIEISALLSCA